MNIVIEKSISDKKNYQYTLLDNNLEVLLISSNIQNEKTDKLLQRKASAAISVQVGSFADPIEAQGLAHFLEHMVQ